MGIIDLEKKAKKRKTDRSDYDEATDRVVDEDKPVRDAKYVALIPKETWKSLMKIATITNVSANEYVNQMIEQFVAEHEADVRKYDKVFEGKGKYS